MALLSKDSYDFTNIVDYSIDEQLDVIAEKKLANGNRKKIYNSYTDILIKIKFGKFTLAKASTVYTNLVDGEYTYTKLDGTTDTSQFLVNKPEISLDNSSYTQSFDVELKRAGD